MSEGLPSIYTVGHSNQSLDDFVSLLRLHEIEMLVDVRSHPYSRWVPHFNRRSLEQRLEAERIGYVYLGRELGGRPKGDEFYGPDGQLLHERVAGSDPYRAGISRLLGVAQSAATAIMCAEEDPSRCHRHTLVGASLSIEGVTVLHIRRGGALQVAQ